MSLESGPDFFYQKETMGTTLLTVVFQDGVIACADSRTSYSSVYVADRVADKLDFVHDHIVACRSGLANETQHAVHKLRFLIESAAIEQGRLPHVRSAARMLQKMTYEKQLETAYLLCGWDPYEGPAAYSVNLGGACLKRDWVAGGSGSTYIYGYCDANYCPNMTREEAVQFCLKAVSLAMRRDGGSGGIIRLAVINKQGVYKSYHTYDSLPYKTD